LFFHFLKIYFFALVFLAGGSALSLGAPLFAGAAAGGAGAFFAATGVFLAATGLLTTVEDSFLAFLTVSTGFLTGFLVAGATFAFGLAPAFFGAADLTTFFAAGFAGAFLEGVVVFFGVSVFFAGVDFLATDAFFAGAASFFAGVAFLAAGFLAGAAFLAGGASSVGLEALVLFSLTILKEALIFRSFPLSTPLFKAERRRC
jgi:hypothetical protein